MQPGACWSVIRYVILLFIFNTVYYDYLIFMKIVDFVGFLSMVIQVMLFYIHNAEPEPADLQWSGQKIGLDQLTDVLWYNIHAN